MTMQMIYITIPSQAIEIEITLKSVFLRLEL
jgi:hypothetical protein